jgi:hypothetical protein
VVRTLLTADMFFQLNLINWSDRIAGLVQNRRLNRGLHGLFQLNGAGGPVRLNNQWRPWFWFFPVGPVNRSGFETTVKLVVVYYLVWCKYAMDVHNLF